MREEIQRRQLAAVLRFDQFEHLPEHVRMQLAKPRKINVPRIVAFYYGGTIGMLPDPAQGNKLAPTNDAEALLRPLAIKKLDREFDIIWFPVGKAIDSTNARWNHWVSIANALRFLYGLCDGYIVCGGTDTKAYLMAAMRFIFPNIGIPIIGCAAQKPMAELGDDATENLYFAILAAASDLSGAHLAFRENLRDGLHITKIRDRGFQAFDSPLRHILGTYDGHLHLNPNAPRRNPFVTPDLLQFEPRFREGIKVVKISPATPSQCLLHDATDPFASSILFITYGAGNVRDEPGFEGDMTHIEAVTQLHQQNYPVALGSPMMDGVVDSPYVSGAKAVSLETGGISGGDTCGATLEVKMMRCLALAWDEKEDRLDPVRFREEMLRNHVNELSLRFKD
jgi:L-asparaginase/Glu-tRNA(Gln) amidotransferase subunit D